MHSNEKYNAETRASGVVDERDELTGVRGYYTLLNSYDYAEYQGLDVYVALCDIDNFRLVNDAYGDNRGNEILARIGQVVQACFGDTHTFRYGSDEFVIVNAFYDEEAFLEKLDSLDQQIAAIEMFGNKLQLTCSTGYVYGIITDRGDLHEAIRLADRKMYEAKRLGKARAVGASLKEDPVMRGVHHTHRSALKTYEIDELTGLANLIHFRGKLESMLAERGPGSEDDPLTLVYFNIENFKVYNERFGFDAGDELLLLVSDAIQEAYPGCLAARFSADQFMVATVESAAIAGILSVRAAFRQRQKDSSIWLKAGINVTTAEDHDPGLACDRAKLACDAIKGRRDVFYREYDMGLKHQITLRRYVLDHFDDALEKGWIKIYYQPIMRVATNEVCDEEALARWVDPVEGLISPGDFIPVLEEARLIHKLDLYMVRRACSNFAQMRADGLAEVPVSLNLSRLDFELCDIVAEVEAILEEYQVPRKMFAVEVTESALAGNQEFLKAEIDRFRSDGFEVWMDDFGSGYSSLNLLKEYKFDLVKIDMEFLRDFESNEQTRVMLAHVISMAKELGLKTLVEGVETEGQLSFLKSIGCGRAQGFLLGRPASLRDMEEASAAHEYPSIEPRDSSDFFEAVGRVNLMRPDPAKDVDGGYVPGDVPCAIISRIDGVYHYLNVSDVYLLHLQKMGARSVSMANEYINDSAYAVHKCFEDALERFTEVGEWIDAEYSANGKRCHLHIKLVADDKDRNAKAVLSIAADEYDYGV